MRFIFSRRFFVLLAIGFIPLSLSWSFPVLRRAVLVYDILLVVLSLIDYFTSRRLPAELAISRGFGKRFAIGDANQVRLRIENRSPKTFNLQIKDEFPPEMKLSETRETRLKIGGQTRTDFFYNLAPPGRGRYEFGKTAVRFLSRFGLVWCQTSLGAAETVKVYPNARRAREMELKALGANSYLAVQRRAIRRG